MGLPACDMPDELCGVAEYRRQNSQTGRKGSYQREMTDPAISRKTRERKDRIIRHDRDNALRRQRSADEGVEIARAALPAAAIEEHDNGRLGRVARLIDIELLSRPFAISETAVLLPPRDLHSSSP